jgi:hypothetical protein
MSRNGSGQYNLPAGNPVVSNTTISSTWANTTLQDIGSALTQSIAKDGQTVATGNLPMGGFRHTNVAAATQANEYARLDQVQNSVSSQLNVSGSNTITATGAPPVTSYVLGARYSFIADASNTGPVTINIDTLGAKAITKNGAIPLTNLDLVAGRVYLISYDGTQFQLINDETYSHGADIASAATVDLDAATGDVIDITGTTTITAITLADGQERTVRFTGVLTITNGASLVNISNADIQTAAGDFAVFRGYPSGVVRMTSYSRATGQALITNNTIPVRQTVLSGPVDNNGFSNFGGSTGSTTVTATGTLIATAANGFSLTSPQDRIGSITNPSWTGLNVNGDMYLYIDINADGTCATGSSTLEPIYRRGGADVVTNGQFVFNIQQMVGKVGNGTVANQTYRVYVGEVNVVSNVVFLIKWYALMGRYESAAIPLPSAGSNITLTHNLGVSSGIEVDCFATNLIAQNGYSVGSTVKPLAYYIVNSANIGGEPVSNKNKNQMDIQAGSNGTGWIQVNIGVGGGVAMTNANWNLVGTARRTW